MHPPRSLTAFVVVAAAGIGGVLGFLVDDSTTDGGATEVAAAVDLATTTSLAATTSTSTTTTTTTAPPRQATLLFTGDLLPHAPVVRQAAAYAEKGWDFRPMFDRVRDQISAADLAVCHLETPLSRDDSSLGGYPVFNAPRALAEAIADAGYDACSTASNHSFDRGSDGVASTLDVLDDAGLGHAGMARDATEDEAAVLYEAGGIVIGHVSATYGLNGFALPSDAPHLVDLIDVADVVAEASSSRAAGAEFVVVSLHWGNEYQHDPTSQQQEWAEAILTSPDVDMIIGHHAHVVQPVDRVGEEWVVYGLGNFLSNQSANCCVTASQDGVIVEVRLHEPQPGVVEVEGIHLTPTWVDRSDYTIVPALGGTADPELDLADTLNASWNRTIEAMGARISVDVATSPVGPLTATPLP